MTGAVSRLLLLVGVISWSCGICCGRGEGGV